MVSAQCHPQIAPDISHQRFKISNLKLNSPNNCITHFCRHGSPNAITPIDIWCNICTALLLSPPFCLFEWERALQIQQFPRVTCIGHYPRKTSENPATPAEPCRDLAEPSERPRRALWETPAEPSERQISSESLVEGCAPRIVTLRNFKVKLLCSLGMFPIHTTCASPEKALPRTCLPKA